MVRCVSSKEGSWHPATDLLHGTDVYGTFVDSYETDTTFSTTWSPDDYSTVLLALTDFSFWAVADVSQLFELGKPVDVTITESSSSSTSYTAEWQEPFSLGCARIFVLLRDAAFLIFPF